jgi:hypothetical protein
MGKDTSSLSNSLVTHNVPTISVESSSITPRRRSDQDRWETNRLALCKLANAAITFPGGIRSHLDEPFMHQAIDRMSVMYTHLKTSEERYISRQPERSTYLATEDQSQCAEQLKSQATELIRVLRSTEDTKERVDSVKRILSRMEKTLTRFGENYKEMWRKAQDYGTTADDPPEMTDGGAQSITTASQSLEYCRLSDEQLRELAEVSLIGGSHQNLRPRKNTIKRRTTYIGIEACSDANDALR